MAGRKGSHQKIRNTRVTLEQYTYAWKLYEGGATEQELREITIEDDGGFVKAAREAGFSEEEISRMTADGDPTRLNVWGYLQVMENRKKLATEKLKAQREKVYLTVQDIFAEMEKNEPADLTKLRDRIPVKE